MQFDKNFLIQKNNDLACLDIMNNCKRKLTRPGEKLFEELLVKTEVLDKKDNRMIFIERDTPLSAEEIQQKLEMLKDAYDTGDDLIAKETLRKVVPTFRKPEEVNKEVAPLEEKKECKKIGIKVAIF